MKYLFLTIALFLVYMLLFCIPVQAQVDKKYHLSDIVIPRMRVIIINDFSGDPDGLFQLAHHVLSPSVEIRGVIGSHLTAEAGFSGSHDDATVACKEAEKILSLLSITDIKVVEGAAQGMTDPTIPQISKGARLIVEEAMRTDTETPLYVVCGAGLTDIASAYLMQPEIADRLTLVWIGGQEYEGGAVPPPGYSVPEYNLNLCIPAARTIFNQSVIPIWQVPRDAYRQCIYSLAELLTLLEPCGEIGNYLTNKVTGLMSELSQYNARMGEVYILGDSPLVLLTALQTGFESDPASSHYIIRQAPLIAPDGTYRYNPIGRNIRVYDRIDTRLMFGDMLAKLKMYVLAY